MRSSRRFIVIALLVAIALCGCVGSVSVGMSVPIGSPYGGYYGGGPYGTVGISSGPIYLH